jgi:DtxR family Mn-dependent transcriptional regulator
MPRIHHDVGEELLEAIWVLREQGRVQATAALDACHVRAPQEALHGLARDGMLELSGDEVRLTAAGEHRAAFVIRRQRLGEVLALEVMGFAHLEEKQAVCEFEHVIAPEDMDRICTQLGHPTLCPDGEPIPRGPCCDPPRPPPPAGQEAVQSLATLPAGRSGRILYVRRWVPSRVRVLLSYGILGGARFELRQRTPALVLVLEGVEVALDAEVAEDIFVLTDPSAP